MTSVRGPAARRGRGPIDREGRWALAFLAPTLIGLAVLSAGPILATLAISLTNWDLLTAPTFAGFDNFVALVSDDRFLEALRNTFFYTIVSVPLGLAIALGLALALNQKIRGIAFIRTAYFLPVVTSTIAIALVWQWIYSADSGLLNEAIGLVGIPPQKWLSDPTLAMPSIIAMSIWQGLGVNVIIFLAGLQAIPSELLDAASVDGAGRWARFRIRDVATPHAGNLLHRGPQPHRRLPGLRPDLRAGQASADGGDDHGRVLHLRERLQVLQDGIRERGVVGPVPDRGAVHGDLLPVTGPLGPLPVSAARSDASPGARDRGRPGRRAQDAPPGRPRRAADHRRAR